jgi:hypothetical protein
MIKKLLLGLAILIAFSCDKNNNEETVKQEIGNIWLSGGIAYCAEQIHLDNGVKLIVKIEDVITFKSGDRVKVKYKEKGINEYCPPCINCEIVEILKAN